MYSGQYIHSNLCYGFSVAPPCCLNFTIQSTRQAKKVIQKTIHETVIGLDHHDLKLLRRVKRRTQASHDRPSGYDLASAHAIRNIAQYEALLESLPFRQLFGQGTQGRNILEACNKKLAD